MKKPPVKPNLALAQWRERILPVLPVAADHCALVLAALQVIRQRIAGTVTVAAPVALTAQPKAVLAAVPTEEAIPPVVEGPWPDDEALMVRLFATLNDGPVLDALAATEAATAPQPIKARRLQVVPKLAVAPDPAPPEPALPQIAAATQGDATETRREQAMRTATELLGPLSDRVISWLWLGTRVALCLGALLWLTAVLSGAGPVVLVLFALLLLGALFGLAAALLELAIRHQDNRQVEIGLQSRPDPFERLAEQLRGGKP